MALYLQMDGVDDYIKTPSFLYRKIVMEFLPEGIPNPSAYSYLVDVRETNWYYSLINSTGVYEHAGMTIQVGTTTIPATGGVYTQPTAKVTMTFTFTANVTNATYFFARYSLADFMKAKVYNIKFYNATNTLLAHYDMTTGTVQDQTANKRHATLVGGTWVDDAAAPSLVKNGEYRIAGSVLPIYSLASIPTASQLRTYHPTKGVSCFELVPITDPLASKVRVNVKGAIKAIKKEAGSFSSVKSLYITSHQDDDIGGMFPDLRTDMIAAGDTGTIIAIYLTAGDDGQGWATHAQNRELGIEAAYASLAGKTNAWTKGNLTLNGKQVPYAKLNGTNIYHIYPRLPDRGLEGLWNGSATTRASVDTNTTYTKTQLSQLIAAVIDTYSIHTVRHLHHLMTLSDDEHMDHIHGGYFSLAGMKLATTLPTTTVGYRVDSLGSTSGWTNISASDVTEKRRITNIYAQFDPGMAGWESFPEEIQNLDKVWRFPHTVVRDGVNTAPTIASSFATTTATDATALSIPYTITNDDAENLTATYTKDGVTSTTTVSKGANTWNVGTLAAGNHTLKILVKDSGDLSSNELTFTITVTATGTTPKLVTDGLVGYWNSKQGVSGTTWANIAPATVGTANSVITGATVVENGMSFTKGSYVQMTLPAAMQTVTPFTWELRLNLTNINDTPDILSDGVAQSIMYIDASVVHIYLANNVEKTFARANGAGELYLAFTYSPLTGVGTLYANGAKAGEVTFATNQRFSRDAAVRMGSYETYNPAGVLDNLRFYNRVLTLAEIQQNYAVGKELGL